MSPGPVAIPSCEGIPGRCGEYLHLGQIPALDLPKDRKHHLFIAPPEGQASH